VQPTTCRPPEIEAEIYEIDELVAQLLARSRLDLTALSDAPVELGELARRAGERAGVPAEKVVEGGPHALRGEPTLLLRALANLVDNAKKHGGGLDHARGRRCGPSARSPA
jgi:two-component system OmpR family sensor kinase